MKEYRIDTLELLKEAVRDILAQIPPDACFTLSGHPGAGKTTLVKTAGKILGVAENIQSPTFNLLNMYSGSLNGKPVSIYHYDLYRLKSDDQLFDLGIADANPDTGVYVFIEWPGKVDIKSLIPDIDVYALTIETKYCPENGKITERILRADI